MDIIVCRSYEHLESDKCCDLFNLPSPKSVQLRTRVGKHPLCLAISRQQVCRPGRKTQMNGSLSRSGPVCWNWGARQAPTSALVLCCQHCPNHVQRTNGSHWLPGFAWGGTNGVCKRCSYNLHACEYERVDKAPCFPQITFF